jgi:Holliday junction resolvase YEN1
MFFRLCNYLALNIQIVFVFDGPDVPSKHGRNEGRPVGGDRTLLRQLLDALRIPNVDAPGEAGAECCRLHILGLVDAVYSGDSDCLPFGCTYWLQDHRAPKPTKVPKSGKGNKPGKTNEPGKANNYQGNTKKDPKYVRVVNVEDIKKYRLDREACVLFAILAGGDYDRGLWNCGKDVALKVAQSGIGRKLCLAENQADCNA